MTDLEILTTLIAIPSPSGQEAAISGFVESYLSSCGVRTFRIGNNVVGYLPGKCRDNSLIFNAHLDTVSQGDISCWNTDPYVATANGDKIYGLGASDEKAGVTSLLLLARAYSERLPACDVWFHFVVNEEQDGSGTAATMEWFTTHKAPQYQQLAAVLVEPTGLEQIGLGHKGNVFVKFTAQGDSGHGSAPEKIKTNCVIEMAKVLLELPALQVSWQKHYSHEVLGSPTLGIGTVIQAGDLASPNKFADVCTAVVDVRTTPALHPLVITLLQDYLKKYKVCISELYSPAGWAVTKPTDRIVNLLSKIIPGATTGIFQGASDMCFFTQHNIPAVLFGPGEREVMHQPNEYCNLTKVIKCNQLLQQVVEDF